MSLLHIALKRDIYKNVDFSDPKINKDFTEYKLETVRRNWVYFKFTMQWLWTFIFFIEAIANRFNTVENLASGLGALMLFWVAQILHLLRNKHRYIARFSGFVIQFLMSVYMTEIVVQTGTYKIYEGMLAMIAVEFYISINVVVDVWMFPVISFLGHTYCLIRFVTNLDDIPDVLIAGLYCPVIIQVFTSYNLSFHIKSDFLLMYSQNTAIERFYKLLKAFPDRIVITQSNDKNDDNGNLTWSKIGVRMWFTNDQLISKMDHGDESDFHEDIIVMLVL